MGSRPALVTILFWLAAQAATGCAMQPEVQPGATHTVYLAREGRETLAQRFSPVFVVYGTDQDHNRIGRPAVRAESGDIFVDTREPVFYEEILGFSTESGRYVNVVYRVHFPGVPYSLVPFYLTAGRNVGVMVVITLDPEDRPLLVTTVHTCGCYAATIPTDLLPEAAVPERWRTEVREVYGERLPGKLGYEGLRDPRLLVYIRPDVHRIMGLEVRDDPGFVPGPDWSVVRARLAGIDALERLPLANGETTSFYHGKGFHRGHVKGSTKPWESLLMGPLSLDLLVGSDKVYGDRRETGNPFYTSLRLWNRTRSDMWTFGRWLRFYGWGL